MRTAIDLAARHPPAVISMRPWRASLAKTVPSPRPLVKPRPALKPAECTRDIVSGAVTVYRGACHRRRRTWAHPSQTLGASPRFATRSSTWPPAGRNRG